MKKKIISSKKEEKKRKKFNNLVISFFYQFAGQVVGRIGKTINKIVFGTYPVLHRMPSRGLLSLSGLGRKLISPSYDLFPTNFLNPTKSW